MAEGDPIALNWEQVFTTHLTWLFELYKLLNLPEYPPEITREIQPMIDVYRQDLGNLQNYVQSLGEQLAVGRITEPEEVTLTEQPGGLAINVEAVSHALVPILMALVGVDMTRYNQQTIQRAQSRKDVLTELAVSFIQQYSVSPQSVVDALLQRYPHITFDAQSSIDSTNQALMDVVDSLHSGNIADVPWYENLFEDTIGKAVSTITGWLVELWHKLKGLIQSVWQGDAPWWYALGYHVLDALWDSEDTDEAMEDF